MTDNFFYLAEIAMVTFWIAAGMLVYVYLGYPLLLAVIAFFVRHRQQELGYCPTISVLIAARNEQAKIGRKIEETLASDYPADKLDVVVVSDASTDGTDSIVKLCLDPRVRLVRIPEHRGKTVAQNVGVEACHGDVIVFSDATTVYHPMALRYLACNYKDPNVGGVSGRYDYFDPEGASPTGLGSIAYWNYENVIKMLQSRIASLTGSSGCIYSVRRKLYTTLPDDACSDLVEPLCVVRQGYRVIFESRALAREETSKTVNEEFFMRVRVITNGLLGIVMMRDLLNFWKFPWVSFQLLSHKVLRWMIPIFLLLLFLANAVLAGRPVFKFLFLLQLIFYSFAIASISVPFHRLWKPLGIPFYFCSMNAAVFFSGLDLCKGKKHDSWETVRT